MKPKDETKPYESRLIEDLHPSAKLIVEEADKVWDAEYPDGPNVFVTCTHRNNARQTELFNLGRNANGVIINKKAVRTWAKAGTSPHNKYPSPAWDVAFLNTATRKLDWSEKLFDRYNAICKEIAAKNNIEITWGADWDKNGIKDKVKQDGAHHELTNWRKFS